MSVSDFRANDYAQKETKNFGSDQENHSGEQVAKVSLMTEQENEQTIIIQSHSVISRLVTKCLKTLNPKSSDSSSPRFVEIKADAKAAGKAITIAEIVKRRISEHGGTITQLTHVEEKSASTEVIAVEPRLHLQGEGYEKPKKRKDAQIIIRLESAMHK
jgi:Alba